MVAISPLSTKFIETFMQCLLQLSVVRVSFCQKLSVYLAIQISVFLEASLISWPSSPRADFCTSAQEDTSGQTLESAR